jgi:predicted site-specific integrase-resolvase
MRLKDYAQQQGISYKTAWRWWKAGKLPGHQMDTGTILLELDPSAVSGGSVQRVAVYARVSSAENTGHLDSQAERLVAYCTARGYQVARVVKEVGAGINDARPKLLALLEEQSIGLIVVEHQDRLTRFGFRYLDTLLKTQGRAIEVVNQAENGTEDLLTDLAAIIYSFCARLYGQQRAKCKTEVIMRELEAKGEADATG